MIFYHVYFLFWGFWESYIILFCSCKCCYFYSLHKQQIQSFLPPSAAFLVFHWSSTLSSIFPKNTETQSFSSLTIPYAFITSGRRKEKTRRKNNSGGCNMHKYHKIPKLSTEVHPCKHLPEKWKKSSNCSSEVLLKHL